MLKLKTRFYQSFYLYFIAVTTLAVIVFGHQVTQLNPCLSPTVYCVF